MGREIKSKRMGDEITPPELAVLELHGITPGIKSFPELERTARRELGWDNLTVKWATGDEIRRALIKKRMPEYLASKVKDIFS